jgi:uncharacterized Zn-binding protein involved in type VI secretion
MGQPAARVGDMHVCPMVTPGLPPVPHVGGPILPAGVPNVLIGGLPAATVGSMCTCVGPPDVIMQGAMTVLIGGRPAARMGDMTAHGGSIVIGCPTVLIGGPTFTDTSFAGVMAKGGGFLGWLSRAIIPILAVVAIVALVLSAVVIAVIAVVAIASILIYRGVTGRHLLTGTKKPAPTLNTAQAEKAKKAITDAKEMLKRKQEELNRWDEKAKANAKKWMGDDSEATRQMLKDRIQKELDLLDKMDEKNFKPGDPDDVDDIDNTYAYVYPTDTTHTVYIGGMFDGPNTPDTGENSRAGTIVHELSHFRDVGGTKDVVHPACGGKKCYGTTNAENLAKQSPADAQTNADNFEFYMEH